MALARVGDTGVEQGVSGRVIIIMSLLSTKSVMYDLLHVIVCFFMIICVYVCWVGGSVCVCGGGGM